MIFKQLTSHCLALTLLITGSILSPSHAAEPVHGIAMHGDLKYSAGFSHFDYVNPDAPKGGSVTQAAIGTFDSFNGFIIIS